MNKIKIQKCICGNEPILIGYFIKGVANRKNYFVKCQNCRIRTRSRKILYKAIEEWNENRGKLFLEERND